MTETAAAPEPVVVNDVDTSEITGTLMEEASLSLQPEVVTDEIQDWDPYALDPEVKVEEASPEANIVSQELQTSVTVEDEIATVTKDKKKLLWDSSQGVECLLFSVAGLKLAIPLSSWGSVPS